MDEITVLEYNSDQNYSIGDFVLYNNNIYKCIKNTNGTQDPSKEEYWSVEITYESLIENTYESLEDNNLEYDENNNIKLRNYTDDDTDTDEDDDDNNYVSGKKYKIGDIVIYSEDNNIYACIKDTDGSQNPSNTEYWEKQSEDIGEIDFATMEDIDGIEFVTNKKTSISNLSTDIDYPSAKAVYEYINNQNFIQTTDLKYESFYNDWNTASFNNFCNSIVSISKDNIGKVFLGSFSNSWVPDIPEEGRAVIEILDENYIHITLYTNNLQKYEYLFNDTNNSGWF